MNLGNPIIRCHGYTPAGVQVWSMHRVSDMVANAFKAGPWVVRRFVEVTVAEMQHSMELNGGDVSTFVWDVVRPIIFEDRND